MAIVEFVHEHTIDLRSTQMNGQYFPQELNNWKNFYWFMWLSERSSQHEYDRDKVKVEGRLSIEYIFTNDYIDGFDHVSMWLFNANDDYNGIVVHNRVDLMKGVWAMKGAKEQDNKYIYDTIRSQKSEWINYRLSWTRVINVYKTYFEIHHNRRWILIDFIGVYF